MTDVALAADRLVKLPEVVRRVGLGKTMLYQMIGQGRFPAPYKLSPFVSRWSDHEISDWITAMKDGFEGKKRKF